MGIAVVCGGCGASLTAKESLAGRQVPCPKCRMSIQVPEALQPSAAENSENDVQRVPCEKCKGWAYSSGQDWARCTDCGHVFKWSNPRRRSQRVSNGLLEDAFGLVTVCWLGVVCLLGLYVMATVGDPNVPLGQQVLAIATPATMLILWSHMLTRREIRRLGAMREKR